MGRCLRSATGTTILATGLMIAAWAAPSSASAATCNVPADRATLELALSDAGCDPIVIAPGTYTATSSFDIDRNLTLTGAGVGLTTLKPNATTSNAINVIAGATVEIRGVGITGGGTGISSLNPANSVTVANSSVRGNTAVTGAGIKSSSDLTVTDSQITGNIASGAGGAGGVKFSGGTGKTASFTRVLFNNNQATGAGESGGAFVNSASGGVANFNDVTFNNNTARGYGGAIATNGGTTANLNGVTMVGNIADNNAENTGDGGGIAEVGASTITVANSIIATNTDKSGGAPDCDVSGGTFLLTRLGYELIRSLDGCTFGGAGDTATGFQTGVDPLVGLIANNGGPTQTMALLSGSPAIDTGNPAVPGSGGSACSATDQRSLPRGGTAGPCDLGAFELQGNHPLPPPSAVSSPTPVTPVTTKKCKKGQKLVKVRGKKKCRKKRKR